MSEIKIIHTAQGRTLHLEGDLPPGFIGEQQGNVYLCPLDAQNAAAIRQLLPWSAPQRVGIRKSIGCGDRLGLATPGHLRAIRAGDMFPVLAQQSMREMARARRSPQQVLDDVTWGVVQANYQAGFGCDADHLKTIEDIDACASAGYLGYTLDPGQYVDDEANTADAATLRTKVADLPWDILQAKAQEQQRFYQEQHHFSPGDYLIAAAKYGRAIAHIVELNAHLTNCLGKDQYDLEVSVDETETVTTLAQHRYIALELQRLGIAFIGLAPRFVGHFEKGVDYIGDLVAFEADYAQHAAIARELGGYKLSIHSGSDKFSLYPIIARHSGENVHVKTAGTSWVEALRVIARYNAPLFQEILVLATHTYAENRASYHVSAAVERIPDCPPDQLAALLDQFDAREVLHVSFGKVLEKYYDDLYLTLNTTIEDYWSTLHQHFNAHIQPFKAGKEPL